MQNYLKSSFHPKESSEEGIHVKQRKYASDLLTFTHMFDAKLVDTKNKKKNGCDQRIGRPWKLHIPTK